MEREEFIARILKIGAGVELAASKEETELWMKDVNKLFDECFVKSKNKKHYYKIDYYSSSMSLHMVKIVKETNENRAKAKFLMNTGECSIRSIKKCAH